MKTVRLNCGARVSVKRKVKSIIYEMSRGNRGEGKKSRNRENGECGKTRDTLDSLGSSITRSSLRRILLEFVAIRDGRDIYRESVGCDPIALCRNYNRP